MAEVKDVLNEAAHAAGSIILEFFHGSFRIDNKDSVNNLVTEVDKLSEKVIIDIIKKHFPEHSIISEEVGELMQESDYQCIIDPIDGTVNFAHGIPIC